MSDSEKFQNNEADTVEACTEYVEVIRQKQRELFQFYMKQIDSQVESMTNPDDLTEEELSIFIRNIERYKCSRKTIIKAWYAIQAAYNGQAISPQELAIQPSIMMHEIKDICRVMNDHELDVYPIVKEVRKTLEYLRKVSN